MTKWSFKNDVISDGDKREARRASIRRGTSRGGLCLFANEPRSLGGRLFLFAGRSEEGFVSSRNKAKSGGGLRLVAERAEEEDFCLEARATKEGFHLKAQAEGALAYKVSS